jgi:hypothetical protein
MMLDTIMYRPGWDLKRERERKEESGGQGEYIKKSIEKERGDAKHGKRVL